MGRSIRQREQAHGIWQDFTTASVAGRRGADTRHRFRRRRCARGDTTIGFIYVGSRDDYGYNQAHAQGAAALKKIAGLKVVEEEKVPETDAVEKTIESMINLDGASPTVPTSFGYYSPHMVKMAKKFPKLRFEHCGGLWSEKDRPTPEAISATSTKPSIFRASSPLHQQDRQARFRRCETDPAGAAQHQRLHARCQARQPEGDHAGDLHRRLVDAGEGSRSHQQPDRPGRRCPDLSRRRSEDHGRERARRGAMVCGLCNVNQSPLAPKAYLTGAEWNWEALYPKFVKMTRREAISTMVFGPST